MNRYIIHWEHRLHDNGPQHIVVRAVSKEAAVRLLEQDNPWLIVTEVEEDDDVEETQAPTSPTLDP